MNNVATLNLISRLSLDGYYTLTDHATAQRTKRNMSIRDIEDILHNPSRIIRTDIENNQTTYKIEGGSKHQRLAIRIADDKLIIVITAMD